MTPEWVTIVSLVAWLILAGSTLRARQVNARKGIFYALVWAAIFCAAATVFGAVG